MRTEDVGAMLGFDEPKVVAVAHLARPLGLRLVALGGLVASVWPVIWHLLAHQIQVDSCYISVDIHLYT